jgi:hypothetical protein
MGKENVLLLLREQVDMVRYTVWKHLLQQPMRQHTRRTALLTGSQMYFVLLVASTTRVRRRGAF